ncbi:MAG: hypothetical protein MJ118_01705 [Clostridia bacterium]|nr:hypothetical protein [Clostridia bacterium]
MVVLNAGSAPYQKEFPAAYGQGAWKNLLTELPADENKPVSPEDADSISLAADSVGIYQLKVKV